MTSFIELTTGEIKILINVNNIVGVSPITHDDVEILDELNDNEEWNEMLEMFGGTIKNKLDKTIDKIQKANTVITVMATGEKGKSIDYYVNEDYLTVKKSIRDALGDF